MLVMLYTPIIKYMCKCKQENQKTSVLDSKANRKKNPLFQKSTSFLEVHRQSYAMQITSTVHGMVVTAMCFWNMGDVLPKSVQNSKMAPRAQSKQVQLTKSSVSLKRYNVESCGLQ